MLRVGVDLVHVPDIAASVEQFGDRYLRRVYSAQELLTCTDADGTVASHRLAARFAAKEAVIKALRPRFGVDYCTIEVVAGADGAPAIVPTGAAARRMLAAAGVVSDSVSLTHDGDYAAAFYIATTSGGPP
ncbi:MAG: acpS [Ilumatobacteraceae bacterium]|nr:acpS [Ilumatobacteraceae bacterium]